MIAVDNLPFYFVEDIGFKRLINHVCPQCNIPSRRYFSEEIIQTINKRVKNKITLQLQEIQAISLTSDIWTCSYNNESIISISGHWIDQDFQRKSGTIQISSFVFLIQQKIYVLKLKKYLGAGI